MKAREISDQQVIDVLLDDFDNDGALFRGLKRSLGNTVTSTAGNVENIVTVDQWEEERSGQVYTWICALRLTCPDCLPLHGTSQSYSEWKASPGLPRTGWSVCRSHCECILIPNDVAEGKAELREPLKRARKVIKKRATELDKGKPYINRKLGQIRNLDDNLRPDYLKKNII